MGYCKRCGCKFKGDGSLSITGKYCNICRPLLYMPRESLAGKDTYCIDCGKVIKPQWKNCRNGRRTFTSGHLIKCDDCKPQILTKGFKNRIAELEKENEELRKENQGLKNNQKELYPCIICGGIHGGEFCPKLVMAE